MTWAWVYVILSIICSAGVIFFGVLASNEFARKFEAVSQPQQSIDISEKTSTVTEYNNNGIQFFNSDDYENDKQSGVWSGGRFLYNVPKHLLTIQANPSDNFKVVRIRVNDAEPNSYVQFKMEYDGGKGFAILTQHENNAKYLLNFTSRKSQYGVRLNENKETKMVIRMPKNSDDTIIRVYALWWETQATE